MDAEVDIIEKIRIEEKYHPLTPGGHIFNAWLGEARPDPEALEGLTRKICRNSDIGFWAYSNALSFCLRCKTLMRVFRIPALHAVRGMMLNGTTV